MATEDKRQSEHLWKNSDDAPDLMSRKLSGIERTFLLLNQALFGQNCPFMGATVSLQRECLSKEQEEEQLSFENLQKRATEAFCQTRWKYPTMEARVTDGDKATYRVRSKDDVEQWAKRSVRTLKREGGWLSLRNNLSRTSQMPTEDGDYFVVYLILRLDEAALPELSTFDVLLHMHHVFVDGSGIRSILNEFLTRLSDPLAAEEIVWGQEIERLYPPSLLLEKEDPKEHTNGEIGPSGPSDRLTILFEPDVGLPVYRPEILQPDPVHRGTTLISHTFEGSSFLFQLLAVGRKHGVKLTALLQAAMLQAVYNLADVKPSSDEVYKSLGAIDLRTNHLITPYNERNCYVSVAASLKITPVECKLVERNDFWLLASYLADQWSVLKTKTGLTKIAEEDAQSFIQALEKISSPSSAAPAKPRTCPYYVSDPPGSQQLSGTYPVAGSDGLQLVLESYQLATDQSQAMASARSHSWNGRLTLCLAFNTVRNPTEKMREFLNEWVRIIKEVKSGK